MNILEKLTEDMKAAMKGKDLQTLEAVRMMIASVKNKAMELGHDLEDSEIVTVLKSDAKKVKDALESFMSAAREDLAQKAREELAIIERYLPEQMSEDELEAFVRGKMVEMAVTADTVIGKVMGPLSAELKGKADGSRIKAMVEKVMSDMK